MLPVRLEIQAFGPYVNKQIIDFKQFEEKRLFLIEGETGSGKTMLLDAMTYAMYGKSSGGQREDLESMRSRFASEDIDTIVEFTFRVKEKLYCFKRRVQVYTKRTKDKGKGIKIKSDAGEFINEVYQPFFENPTLRKIEEKAEEIIGLSYTQFVQVMVLPQGKFEQFLTSKSEDKQEILNTLFQMERWDKVNEKLTKGLQEKRNEIEKLKQVCQGDLKILEEETIDDAKEHLIEYRNEIKELTNISESMHIELEQLQQSLVEQIEYDRRKKEIIQLKNEYTRQMQKYENMKKIKQKVCRWKELQSIYSVFVKLNDSNNRVKQRNKVYEDAVQQFEQVNVKYTTLSNKKEEVEQIENNIKIYERELEVIKEQLSLYNQYQDVCKKTTESKEKLEIQKRIVDELEQHKIILSEKQKEYSISKKEYEDFLDEYESYKETYKVYEIAKQRYENKKVILNEIQDQELICQLRKNEYLEKEQKLESLKKEHEELYQCFLESSALQLAQELKEGEPCPVCGATHHPQLAVLEKASVDLLQLRKLKQRLDQFKKEVESSQKQLDKEKSILELKKHQKDDIERQIVEFIHCEFCEDKFNKIKKIYNDVLDTEEKITNVSKKIDKINNDKEINQIDFEQQNNVLYELKQKWMLSKAEEEHMLEKLPNIEERDSQQLYINKKNEIQKLEKMCMQRKNEVDQISMQYTQVKTKVQTMREELEKASKENELIQNEYSIKENELHTSKEELERFPSYEELSKKEQEEQQYFIHIEYLQNEIQEKNKQIKNNDTINVDELKKQYDEKRNIVKRIETKIIYIQNKIDLYDKTIKRINKNIHNLNIEEPKFLQMQHFVKAMRGDNGIGIERYVLGILLDHITMQANKLLTYIHEGRYQIYRNDDTTGRTRKYGLELSIFDSYSMEARNVVSLSGGEKFLVSLAMSLALSMVVQARNGGIRFDCLFIDEGFGSLDEHSIADALAVLQTMTHGKGMIGIISHVEVLKENIEQGIKVVKSREGSNLYLR